MVIAAAAWSAFWAGDLPLAQRRAEDAVRAPASGDLISLGLLRLLLAEICTRTGQPERGASIARQARQEAAELGIEILVAEFLATEAMAWTAAGDYAAARLPAMEAVEVARRVQNPAASAFAFLTAAGAIWPSDPQAALMLIEDSLALARAGASDPVLDTALMLAGLIRARTGDLPGALAALQEAMAQQHADGDRLLLGITLQIAAVVLAGLGEAEPAAVLAGAFSAHFPPDISAVPKDEQMWIGEAQSLARRALGEAAYSAALARGAAMDDDQIVGYAQGEYRRLVAPRAEPGAQAPESPPGPGAADPPGMTVLPRQDNVPQQSWRGQAPRSFPASPRWRPPTSQPDATLVTAGAPAASVAACIRPPRGAEGGRTGRSARSHSHRWQRHQPRGIGREDVPLAQA